MSLNDLKPSHECRCPRCGYNQRGVMTTWSDLCPLQGTCSECGLQFFWAEVIVPDKFEPPWCIEFAPRLLGVPRAALKTFFISFWPWTFWSRLKMSQKVRWRRLALYCCLLLAPLLLCYVMAQGALAARMRYLTQQEVANYPYYIGMQLRYEQMNLHSLQAAKKYKTASEAERAVVIADVPQQFGRDQDYGQYIDELSRSPDQLLTSQIATKQRTVAALQAQVNTPPKILISYAGAIIEAVTQPLAQTSSGSVQLGDGSLWRYPAPIELYDLIGSIRTGPASWSDDLVVHLSLTAVCVLLLLILMPASFILLPVSRRRAKVRWAHVVRIFVYSMFAFISVLLILYAIAVIQLVFDSQLALRIYRAVPLIAWIGITIWWAVAIKRYLKMAHAAAVAGLMSFMLALLLSPALLQVFPDWMARLVLN